MEARHAEAYKLFRDDARTALDYLDTSDISAASIEGLLQIGESERAEFKRTAIGIPGSSPSQRRSAKYKVARTAAAMLSSGGGWVVLGADDSGSACGLPELNDVSIDLVQLQLADFLVEKLGLQAACRIAMQNMQLGRARLIVLACRDQGRVVTVLEENGRRAAYRRQGPRTKQVP